MTKSTVRSAAAELHARLAKLGTPTRAVSAKAYMKSALAFHGTDNGATRTVAKVFVKERSDLTIADLFLLVEALYATNNFDDRTLALMILDLRRKELAPDHVEPLLSLVRRSQCWAHVDEIATHLMPAALRDERRAPALRRRWAKDRDFWVQRTALLCDLPALRSGTGDFELFAALAAPLLEEKEFFIRKAIGWVLREASKQRPGLVEAFVDEHRERLSRVTLREAIKYL